MPSRSASTLNVNHVEEVPGELAQGLVAWRDVGDAEVEERRFGAEQRGGQRAHTMRVRSMTAETGDQRITAGLQLRLRERVGGSTEQGRHFDGR